ncbi:MAG: winged helix-turn-helix transcriptional regulator [Sphingomonas sp.]|nr:winged helix-turn-helix transcriptional regulator [Sphingomonas sp.]
MAQDGIQTKLVDLESQLDRAKKRLEDGLDLVNQAQTALADIQSQVLGSPTSVTQEDSDEAASQMLTSLKAQGNEMPETLCDGRMAVDPMQRLIRIDGNPIGITEMEYRVLELLAYARNNVVTRNMLLKHLYRRSDDQPQPKIIDVFISKLRKKLRSASGGAEFIETIPQRGWILRDADSLEN